MRKPNRKRNRSVTVRMNDTEYADFLKRVAESGLSQQSYVISAIRGATITSSDTLSELKEISKTFADYERQLRGLATNVNQMAHVANGQGLIPTEDDLRRISNEINSYRRESEHIWQSIRSSINGQTAMEP